MNCERFQTVVADLARDDSMDAALRAAALEHVGACARCAQIMVDQNALSEGLQSVAAEMKSLGAPADVEERVLAAFRERIGVRPIQSARPRWPYWTSAAAAVLLVVFGLWGLWLWRSQVASTKQLPAQANTKGATAPTPKEQLRPEPVDGTQAPVQSTQSSNGVAPRTPRVRGQRASHLPQVAKPGNPKPADVKPATEVATTAETNEVATDFVPVGYGSAWDLQDGGQLVRVELPRSALARFGLPMNMDRADESIKADVLVGADGLARAIRFVK